MSEDTRYLRERIMLAMKNADRTACGLRPIDALDEAQDYYLRKAVAALDVVDRDVRRLRRERDHARTERARQRAHADLVEASLRATRERRDQLFRACAELREERRAARKLLASIPGAPETLDLLELARWASERA